MSLGGPKQLGFKVSYWAANLAQYTQTGAAARNQAATCPPLRGFKLQQPGGLDPLPCLHQCQIPSSVCCWSPSLLCWCHFTSTAARWLPHPSCPWPCCSCCLGSSCSPAPGTTKMSSPFDIECVPQILHLLVALCNCPLRLCLLLCYALLLILF